jgi:hypothetical protein
LHHYVAGETENGKQGLNEELNVKADKWGAVEVRGCTETLKVEINSSIPVGADFILNE